MSRPRKCESSTGTEIWDSGIQLFPVLYFSGKRENRSMEQTSFRATTNQKGILMFHKKTSCVLGAFGCEADARRSEAMAKRNGYLCERQWVAA